MSKATRHLLAIGAITILTLSCVRPARASFLTPGDILISTTTGGSNPGSIFEVTQSGATVQRFTVPASLEPNRGIATDSSGRIEVYTGTFSASLTTITPTAGAGNGTLQNHTLAGLSTVSNLFYGGVATLGNYAYLSDMSTGLGDPNGIVRFNLTDFTTTRFGQGVAGPGDNITLNVGLNGLLYALYPGSSTFPFTIDVYDPNTMEKLKTINVGSSFGLAGIAVDAAGNIYATGALDDGHIYRFDANGNETGSLNTGFSNLTSLSLSNSGQLMAASQGSHRIILTDTSLSAMTSFSTPDPTNESTVFATFATAPNVVPEPSSIMLLGLGLMSTLVGLRRRR